MSRHNDQSIKDVLSQIIKNNPKLDKGLTLQRLQEVWKESLGQVINNYTDEMTYHKGCVRVRITSAPLRQELSMGKVKIINILNEHLGSETIKELTFL